MPKAPEHLHITEDEFKDMLKPMVRKVQILVLKRSLMGVALGFALGVATKTLWK